MRQIGVNHNRVNCCQPRRRTLSGRLGNAPVYFALGQVGFSPVMSMASFIPEIQEQLRTTGFPEFHVGQFTQVRLSSDGKEAEALDSHPLWIFMNESRSLCFVLSVDSLTLQTTASQRHDVFISEAIRGLAVVRSVVGVGSVKRIGLRCLGAIQPEPSEDVNDYLAEGLHGVAVTGRLVAGATELVFDRDLSRWGTTVEWWSRFIAQLARLGFRWSSNRRDWPCSRVSRRGVPRITRSSMRITSFNRLFRWTWRSCKRSSSTCTSPWRKPSGHAPPTMLIGSGPAKRRTHDCGP